jgi:hypothetical protein
MRPTQWQRCLAWTLCLQACSKGIMPKSAPRDSAGPRAANVPAARAQPVKPAAYSSDSTFDTTIVQDVRGERRFDYLVRRDGPRYALLARGDSVENQVAELFLIGSGDSVVQRIEAMPEAPPRGERDIVFEDINGDGYADLKVLGSWGTGGLSWWTWHFDPRSRRLVADSSAADPVM